MDGAEEDELQAANYSDKDPFSIVLATACSFQQLPEPTAQFCYLTVRWGEFSPTSSSFLLEEGALR